MEEFTPELPKDALFRQADRFLGENSPWNSRPISIDMVKQYLMLRISAFRAEELSADMGVAETPFRVPPQHQERFFAYLCDEEAGKKHLTAYPPVHEGATAKGSWPQRHGSSAELV